MLGSLKHKSTKEDYTRGMQYIAKMNEPNMDRPEIGQNKNQNMLRWELKGQGKMAYKLSHKQGNNA